MLSLALLRWLFAALLSLGGGMALLTGGLWLRERLWPPDDAPLCREWYATNEETGASDAAGGRGDTVSRAALQMAGVLAGVGSAVALFGQARLPLVLLGLFGGLLPSLRRAYRLDLEQRRLEVEVRHFLYLLQDALLLCGGVHPALHLLAGDERGTIGRRLWAHLQLGYEAPEVLERLAEELGSRLLRRLVERLVEAEEGRLSAEEALSQLLREVEQEELQRLKGLPAGPGARFVAPLVLMVLPVLALLLYPLGV